MDEPARGIGVGITGANTDLGSGLVERLQADAGVRTIVSLGGEPLSGPKVTTIPVDLRQPGSDRAAADALRAHQVDTLFHLAFAPPFAVRPLASHEADVLGTIHVLAAAGSVRLRRLVVASRTALYGPADKSPAILTESHPLRGVEAWRAMADRIEVEHHVSRFGEAHPDSQVLLLRFAPIVGAGSHGTLARLLRSPVVPTLFGFDPLWQVVSREDAVRALHLALRSEARGALNIVGDEALPLSSLLRLAGARPVPLPAPLFGAALALVALLRAAPVSRAAVPFLRHGWVADGSRAQAQLAFTPQVPVRTALGGLVTQRSA